jgi:asparagine synthase (glutamine-hydrolysing)
MCGIWFCYGEMPCTFSPGMLVRQLINRGPEDQQITDISGVGTLGFTRLAINGLNANGMQPFSSGGLTWVCNGEIYNWRELASEFALSCNSGSDCEILGQLYERFADNLTAFFRALDGVFAFIIIDKVRDRVVVARDPYGVRPLYVAEPRQGAPYKIFASEMKAIVPLASSIRHVLPGTYEIYSGGGAAAAVHRYHTVPFLKSPALSVGSPLEVQPACAAVRASLEAAVRKRITTTERPVAALLSGGLDSSLIVSLVVKELKRLCRPRLKTFSIGMEGSTDLKFARWVADYLGTDHTELCLTEDEFFRAIPEVIRDIESYDTTTVRASVGNWLVSREIAERTDCKVVFNGDGSDEVWGSYLYFNAAPSGPEFEEECERLLQDIHMFDVLRSDRSISSHGLEPRTPFLDKEFVGVAMSVPTAMRRPSPTRAEKWLLRTAFDDGVTLPKEVLWRRKEAFSDGVSGTEKSWYQIVQERCEAVVPPNWRELAEKYYAGPACPKTAEMFYYRFTYESEFGRGLEKVNVPYFWMPKWVAATDPSARTLAVYTSP